MKRWQLFVFLFLVASFILARGQRPNCRDYEDAVGALLLHTAERRDPCEGLEAGSSCNYQTSLTLPDGTEVEQSTHFGCCVAEKRGGFLFCSSSASKDASPTAGVLSNTVGPQYLCRGGDLVVDERVTESDAQAYGFELVCESPGFTRVCTRAGTANCQCMLGDIVDRRQFCRCIEPNEGAACASTADCTGGGNCTVESAWLQELAPQDKGAGPYFQEQRNEDGTIVQRRKATSWFGDEREGTEPAAAVRWEYRDERGEWQEYGVLSSAVLEEAFRDGRQTAVIGDAAGGRGQVDLRSMAEVTAAVGERPVRRSQVPGGVAHAPEKFNAESLQRLPGQDAFHRASVSP